MGWLHGVVWEEKEEVAIGTAGTGDGRDREEIAPGTAALVCECSTALALRCAPNLNVYIVVL